MDKKQMRVLALSKRDSLKEEQRKAGSEKIIRRLVGLSEYQRADAILTYVSFRSEAATFALIHRAFADGKAVFVPKVLGRDMEFFKISSVDDLREGYQGILEPDETLAYIDWISHLLDTPSHIREEGADRFGFPHALICLPGAAFDRERHRIGYGGGFYDRYLSKTEEIRTGTVTTIALAFDCQIFEEIPWEAHDIRPAFIVAESEIIS